MRFPLKLAACHLQPHTEAELSPQQIVYVFQTACQCCPHQGKGCACNFFPSTTSHQAWFLCNSISNNASDATLCGLRIQPPAHPATNVVQPPCTAGVCMCTGADLHSLTSSTGGGTQVTPPRPGPVVRGGVRRLLGGGNGGPHTPSLVTDGQASASSGAPMGTSVDSTAHSVTGQAATSSSNGITSAQATTVWDPDDDDSDYSNDSGSNSTTMVCPTSTTTTAVTVAATGLPLHPHRHPHHHHPSP